MCGMDKLRTMKLFVRVVEAASFSEVAKETGLSQSTISKAILALETRLSVRLLNRTTRQVNVTEVGRDYYHKCKRILDMVDETEENVSNQRTYPVGWLKLSVPISFGRLYMVRRIVSFLAKYPDVKVDLAMNDHTVDLVKEGFDLAIRTGNLNDSSLIARKIGENFRVMVATPNYLDLHGDPSSPDDLAKHNCIRSLDSWRLAGPNRELEVCVSGNLRVNNAEGIREAVLHDLGIGILPLWAVHEEIEGGRLRIVLADYTPASKDIYAICPYSRYISSKIRLFIEFLVDDLKRVNYLSSIESGTTVKSRRIREIDQMTTLSPF